MGNPHPPWTAWPPVRGHQVGDLLLWHSPGRPSWCLDLCRFGGSGEAPAAAGPACRLNRRRHHWWYWGRRGSGGAVSRGNAQWDSDDLGDLRFGSLEFEFLWRVSGSFWSDLLNKNHLKLRFESLYCDKHPGYLWLEVRLPLSVDLLGFGLCAVPPSTLQGATVV